MAVPYERERPEGLGVGSPWRGLLPVLRSCARWARRPLEPGLRLWRRSIQLRVVATTLLMSLGVVLLLGVVVIGQVKNGLLDAKRQAAQSQAIGGFSVAKEEAGNTSDSTGTGTASRGQTDAGAWLTALVGQLASGGRGSYSVVALSSDAQASSDSAGTRGPRATGLVLPEDSVPAQLRSALDSSTKVQWQYTTLLRKNSTEGQAALAVGQRMEDPNGHSYQLYYLFPFDQEEKTLNLVKGTLATAGIFVVVLLGAIAWMVVRQVVTPVRMAAEISERLAAGRLQERMKVSGEDDIARLGESFNKMAQTLQVKIQQLEDLSRMQRRFVSDVSHELRTPSPRSGWPPTSSMTPARTSTRRPPGPPNCCRPSSTASSHCCPTCWRSAASTPERPTWPPNPST